jgi:mannose/fructose-specific phosphotransferase system component IIA
MVSLSEKYTALFARVLAIFSSSSQNQSAMAAQRHTTKVLSCMNLTIMSHVVDFQQHGWTVLANTLATPSENNKKVEKLS